MPTLAQSGARIRALVFCIVCLNSSLAIVINDSEFILDTSPRQVSSRTAVASVAARSDIECAAICVSVDAAGSSNGNGCKSWAFSSTNGDRCFLSANRTFDFGAAESTGAVVYRAPMTAPPTAAPPSLFSTMANRTITIGSRQFYIFQQRVSDKYSFARNWSDYENGFGDSENFWAGLKTINSLSGATPRLFRMEARNYQDGLLYVCEYSSFSVADASTQYKLSISGYLTGSSNTTGDSFTYNNNLLFSTIDAGTKMNCAQNDGGAGWWFSSCSLVNPNGRFDLSVIATSTNSESYMQWMYAGPNSNRPMLRAIRLMLQI